MLYFQTLNAEFKLFTKRDIIITINFDDIFICSTKKKEINNVKKVLKAKFYMFDLRPISFKFRDSSKF